MKFVPSSIPAMHPSTDSAVIRLHAVEGPFRGRVFNFASQQNVVFGRAPECGIGWLDETDAAISRKHFALEIQARQVWARDLGSSHGTFVNGHACPRPSAASPVAAPFELRDGDLIRAGDTTFRVCVQTSATTARFNWWQASASPASSGGHLIVHNLHGPPKVIGFELIKSLGRDHSGGTYLCRREGSDGFRIIKVLRGEGKLEPGDLRGLSEYLSRLGALRHEGLVGVLDYGLMNFPGGGWSCCVELDHWRALNAREVMAARGGPLAWHEVYYTMRHCLAGLAYAHAQGILHGNLHPTSILMNQRRESPTAKIIWDFGLSRVSRRHLQGVQGFVRASEETTETAAAPEYGAQALGSGDPFRPAALRLFDAPEQIQHPDWLSPTADVWSLGAVFYFLLTACSPWQTRVSACDSLTARVVPLAECSPRIAGGAAKIREFIDRAIAVDPGQRFADALEMWRAFQSISAPSAVLAMMASAHSSTS